MKSTTGARRQPVAGSSGAPQQSVPTQAPKPLSVAETVMLTIKLIAACALVLVVLWLLERAV